MWERECPTRGLSRPVRCFASRYGGGSDIVDYGSERDAHQPTDKVYICDSGDPTDTSDPDDDDD